jgi:hypothetical protein
LQVPGRYPVRYDDVDRRYRDIEVFRDHRPSVGSGVRSR